MFLIPQYIYEDIVAHKYFMFTDTNYSIDQNLLQQAVNSIPNIDFRLAINKPTGDFFYDPWVIKDEYKGTVWETIYNSLPENKGEARLIKLEPGTCYRSHSDIDDRWHLSISSDRSYLVDLESDNMYHIITDGKWHAINTGIKHSAVNFGSRSRTQLVVRKLLTIGNISSPANVVITLKEIVEDRRFIFDDIISPWLNRINKQGALSNFKFQEFEVTFTTEQSLIPELKKITESHFNVNIT